MSDDAEPPVAIVTGATGGIGLATVELLVDRGWQVLAAGHAETAPDATDRLTSLPGTELVRIDLRDPTAGHALVAAAVDRFGRLSALVNNAGAHLLATTTHTTDEQWTAILDVNLGAAFRLAREAIPVMTATGGGTVVNVASEAGLVAVAGQVAYNVSKAAMVMLTRSIAVDHADEGIRAISVCPGTTTTPLVRSAIASSPDPKAHEQMLSQSRPAKRLGRPEEIAAAIAFVLGDDVAYMTGSELVIDGGYTAR